MGIINTVYLIAFCIFLAGAAKSFRENGSRQSLWIMGCAVMIDFLASVLPTMGVKSISIDIELNATIIFGIILGVIVWILFVVALFVWRTGRMPLFHFLIGIIEIAWFIDLLSFIYGIYRFPGE